MIRYEKAIFIIGSTAVGKTKLGIDLALHINGEIISSDSMQIYQKASLMTAKPTLEEQKLVKHHLIDILPISTTDFTVREYQQLALDAAQDIISRGKTPIFVGGTMYYIESILYDRVFTPGDSALQEPDEGEILRKIQEFDEKLLTEIDSKNSRHLRNAYNYIVKTGNKPSEKSNQNKLRFDQSFIIFLYCDTDVLESRIRKRIENMIADGGLDEIREILENSNQGFTKGVLQSIGYKEFEPFMSDSTKLQECIDSLVTSTLQYSKKQIRWINNRLKPYLFLNVINTNNADAWEEIKNKGIDALNNDVNSKEVVLPKIEAKNCEVCGVKLFGNSEWIQHLQSRKHKKNKDKDFSDDEEVRKCEVCEKVLNGKKHWINHIQSRKHLRKTKNFK